MKNLLIRLDGMMIAQSPINITPHNAETRKRDQSSYKEVSFEVIMKDGNMYKALCIPASTMRGGLRRAVLNVAADLEEREGDDRLTLEEYHYSSVGGVRGSGSEGNDTVAKRAERRAKNPVVSLFGASQPWDRSRARISAAYADPDKYEVPVPMQIIGSRRADDMIARPGLEDLLSDNPVETWKALTASSSENTKAKKEIDALKKKKRDKTLSLEDLNEIDRKIEAIDGAKSGANSILMPILHAAIPRGTEFRQDMTLQNVSPEEVGLFLAAMDDFWLRTPEFGAKVAHGYGLVSGEWTMTVREGRSWKTLGTVKVEPFRGLQIEDWMTPFFDAWDAYKASGVLDFAAPEA